MFLEPNHRRKDGTGPGWIEVISGSMFSGKTEELIRRLKRAMLASEQVEIFKPLLDNRYSLSKVVSHDANEIPSHGVESAVEIIPLSKDFDVVGIDEAQFLGSELVEVVNQLANNGKRVIVAGLDMDFKGTPFEPMDQLMAIAEYVTKVHAVCMQCGNMASFSYRLNDKEEKIVIGEQGTYMALCRSCFYEKMSQD